MFLLLWYENYIKHVPSENSGGHQQIYEGWKAC